jgi:MFS family permease
MVMRAESDLLPPRANTGSVESRASWLVALWSVLIFAIANSIPYASIVALKPIAVDLGTPRWVPALANSMIFIGTGVGGIPMGWLADRVGVRWTVLFGATMMGAGAMLSSGGSLWQLYVGDGLLIGLLGNAGINGPVMVYASRWFDRRRGTALALVASGQYLAGVICPPLVNAAIERFGWRQTLFAWGLCAFATLAPLSLLLRKSPPRPSASGYVFDGPKSGAPVLGLRPGQALALMSAAGFCCCIAMSMPISHLIAFCGDLGYGASRGAEMLALLLGCGFLSRQFWGLIADRLGGLWTILLGSACQLVGLSLYVMVGDLAGLYVVSAAFGFGFGGLVPSYFTAVRELFAASEAGWRIPTLQLFTLGGMAAGTWLAGLIFDWTADYRFAFATGVMFNFANLVIVGTLVLRRHWLRRHGEPAPGTGLGPDAAMSRSLETGSP